MITGRAHGGGYGGEAKHEDGEEREDRNADTERSLLYRNVSRKTRKDRRARAGRKTGPRAAE